MISRARGWTVFVERDTVAVWLAVRDSRVPWWAKMIAAGVAVYALRPIDLIPDFVPVLGHLDDAVIVPAGLLLAIRPIPGELMEEFRATAAARFGDAERSQ
jgi:uncharacterized membrane protein YkvA (DUF1232 family)